MSRPLIAQKAMVDHKKTERKKGAAEFHAIVFKTHGSSCYFCGNRATDAMHVIDRSQLGNKRRYAVPEVNGRPGCRTCHDKQTDGKLEFPRDIRREAVHALNKICHPPLPEPM